MREVTCCQPLKFVSFTMLLWQDVFCQVLHEMAPPILADKYSVTFLPVCRNLAGPILGLDLICVFTHTWPIEACSLKSAVKTNFPARLASLVVYFFQFSLGFLLASCGITLLLPRHSLLISSILLHRLPSPRFPLWGFTNPLRPVPPETFPSTPQ